MTRSQRNSQVFALVALSLSTLVIFGWLFNFPLLIQLEKTLVPMQFNTALCMMLLAISLLLSERNRWVSDGVAFLTYTIAGLTLIQYVLSINIGIDELFIRSYILTESAFAGRMAPNTALCYILLSISIILFHLKAYQPVNHFISIVLLMIAAAISILSIIGYAFNVPQAYGFEGLTNMAIHTAIGLFLLSVSLLLLNKGELKRLKARGQWAIATGIFFSSTIFFLLLLQSLSLYYHDSKAYHKKELITEVKAAFFANIRRDLQALETYFERVKENSASLSQQGSFYLNHITGLELLVLDGTKKRLASPKLSELNQSILLIRCEKSIKQSPKVTTAWQLIQSGTALCASYKRQSVAIFDMNKRLQAASRQIGISDAAFTLMVKENQHEKARLSHFKMNGLTIAVQVNDTLLRLIEAPDLLYGLFFAMSLLLSFAIAACYWMFCYIFVNSRVSRDDLNMLEHHEALWHNLGAALLLVDGRGKIQYCNDVVLRMTQYQADDLRDMSITKIFPELEVIEPLSNHYLKLLTKSHHHKNVNVSINFSGRHKNAGALMSFIDNDKQLRRETSLINKNKQMQLVLDVTIHAGDSGDINDFINLCLTRLCDDLGWTIGHFHLIDDAYDGLVQTHLWYSDRIDASELIQHSEKAVIKKGINIAGRVLMNKQVLWLEDLSLDTFDNRRFDTDNYTLMSAVALPVILNQQVAGVVELFSADRKFEDNAMMMTFELIAEQVARMLEQQQTKRQLLDLKYYDSVTGLPNRDYFMTMLDAAALKADNEGTFFSLIYLDIDNFKKINDLYGHVFGDKLLKDVASKLTHVHDDSSLARVGGDEFAMVIKGLSAPIQAGQIARKILNTFDGQLTIADKSVQLSISMGIVIYPYSAKTKEDLFSNVEVALKRAKENGKNQYQFFSEDLNRIHRRRIIVEEGLRTAIEKCELEVYYQPQFSVDGYHISGFEALLRWNSKLLGEVSPYEFIPIAEEVGLINEIGLWVMQESMRQFVEWRELFVQSGINPVLAINVSVIQITQAPLVDQVSNLLKRYDFNPQHLVLEITETALSSNIDFSRKVLNQLSQLGVGIAIDDFGTGYSSLSSLQTLPFTELKIDKSFIDKISESEDARAIVKAILQLARVMHLSVVAEGVEHKDQLDFLVGTLEYLDKTNYFVQGYYFSKPLNIKDAVAFIKDSKKET